MRVKAIYVCFWSNYYYHCCKCVWGWRSIDGDGGAVWKNRRGMLMVTAAAKIFVGIMLLVAITEHSIVMVAIQDSNDLGD